MDLGLGSEICQIQKKATYDNERKADTIHSRVQTCDAALERPYSECDRQLEHSLVSNPFRRLGSREAYCGEIDANRVCACEIAAFVEGHVEGYLVTQPADHAR